MSSTSSSTEREAPKRSATDILASRYRHLFVLPSSGFLLVYAAIASFFLTLASKGIDGVEFTFVPALLLLILSVLAVSSALVVADKKSIATFRRTIAVLLTGEVAWLFCVACGIVYSFFQPGSYAVTNAILFGAFLCAGFEFLVIYGAFIGNAPLALAMAAIHPASTLIVIRMVELSAHLDLLAAAAGSLAFFVLAGFTFLLKRRKTSRGYDALELFRSFMKTWAAGETKDLEAILTDHSEESEVTTKVLRFQSKFLDMFLVLPGVHPGPFHPIGSYDLPGALSRAFKDLGQVMTFHRPGSHERNLITTEETSRYAERVSEFAKTIVSSPSNALLRGPVHAKVGKAAVSSSAFSDDLILTISFAPLGSDDLSAEVESELAESGAKAGFSTSIVDAHNSIARSQEIPDTLEPGWRELFARMRNEDARAFRFGYSHSKELGFPSAEDLTENGIALAMVETGEEKSVLVLADANNAVPPLRGQVATALESSGYQLVEFCTSDSHNLAARGLTVARGYQALGEDTRVESIVKLVVDMAKLAETRLTASAYGSGELITNVKVFGAQALEEFAGITQSSSRLGREYLRFAAVAVGALLLFALVA